MTKLPIKLGFDISKMVNLISSSLKIFSGLGVNFGCVFLLLIQLIDHFILIGNFVIQVSDGMVTVGFFLFKLLDCKLNVFHILLDDYIFSFKNLLVSSSSNSFFFHLNKFLSSSGKVCFQLDLQFG